MTKNLIYFISLICFLTVHSKVFANQNSSIRQLVKKRNDALLAVTGESEKLERIKRSFTNPDANKKDTKQRSLLSLKEANQAILHLNQARQAHQAAIRYQEQIVEARRRQVTNQKRPSDLLIPLQEAQNKLKEMRKQNRDDEKTRHELRKNLSIVIKNLLQSKH
jgi:hypothetical protein